MYGNSRIGFYPATFDLQEFLQKYSNHNIKGFQVVKILTPFLYNTKNKGRKNKIRLNAEKMKNYAGDGYKAIVDSLIQEGVIELVKDEIINVSSREYQLCKMHRECSTVKEYDISTNIPESLRKSNLKKQKEQFISQLSLPKASRAAKLPEDTFYDQYRDLIYWLNHPLLKFDQSVGYELLDKKFELTTHITVDSLNKKNKRKYRYGVMCISSFREDNIYYYCDKNFRFYSNITSLPKYLRGAISFDGQPLVGVDISNTHPLLLCNLADTFFLDRLYKGKHIEVDEEELAFIKALLKQNPDDFNQYKEDVQNGIIYEKLNEQLPHLKRKQIKTLFLSSLFDDGIKQFETIDQIRTIFSQTYPTIYRLVKMMKSSNHRYSSNTLMSMEANNLVQKFIQNFYYKKEHEHIPIYTIHDCFLTISQYKQILITELTEYFNVNLGLKVSLKPVDCQVI